MEYFQGEGYEDKGGPTQLSKYFWAVRREKEPPNDRLAEIGVGNTGAPPIDGSAEMMIIKISWLDHRKM